MKQAFSWKNLNYPVILCPPMDGITDMAYRELVSDMNGSGARYCEFINVKGLIYQNPKTLFELQYTENQRPIIAQLFGNEPEDFYAAAKLVVQMGFDAIDINMGCPAHKVASKGCGCALMEDTENAKEIVRMTIEGANEEWLARGNTGEYEVTAKMRLGVSAPDRIFEHGLAMIDAGVKAVAIHGRTLKQMYTGFADWKPVGEFKELVKDKVFVFGSGDVKSLWEAFQRIMTTGVDGVMIGRGSFGNPWVFEQERVLLMKQYIKESQEFLFQKTGRKVTDDLANIPNIEEIQKALENKVPTMEELKAIALRHAQLMVADKGEKGIVQMRKHLSWYFTNFEGAKELRSKLVVVNSIQEMEQILSTI